MFHPGNAMIALGSLFRCGLVIESIASKLLVIEQIPQLEGETGASARSALSVLLEILPIFQE
jgi:hypothetical protein